MPIRVQNFKLIRFKGEEKSRRQKARNVLIYGRALRVLNYYAVWYANPCPDQVDHTTKKDANEEELIKPTVDFSQNKFCLHMDHQPN